MPTTVEELWTQGSGIDYYRYLIKNRTWYRQPKPWVKPLPYFASTVLSTGNGSWSAADVSYARFGISDGVWSSHRDSSQAKAYARFLKEVHAGKAAALAINIAQRKQAFDMITKRVGQLLRFARAARKLDFKGAASALGLRSKPVMAGPLTGRALLVRPPTRKGKNPPLREVRTDKAKDAAGVWLEYTFGWVPAIEDIHTACEVLQESPPPMREKLRGRGTSYFEMQRYQDDVFPRVSYVGRVRTEIGAKILVTNPDLYLANRLGLVNPASVLWDGIPFSFVVDWFIPVGKFLNSLTDFIGVEVTDYYTTTSWSVNENGTGIYLWDGRTRYKRTQCRLVERTLTPPTSAPPRWFPRVNSGWHAATSMSLLIQQLRK